MSTAQRVSLVFLSLVAFAALPGVAQAHVGLGSTNGFLDGVVHPFSGLDHLCAMFGVGLWAAQRGGRGIWLLPVAFVIVMTVGGLLGMAHVFIPFIEPGIIASVLVVGLLVATAIRLPLAASACLVALFALFHGHAHGAEMPSAAAGFWYGVGFACSTMALLFCGVGLGLAARRSQATWPFRYSGAAIVTCGIGLCAVYLG
jgi:urease accessory protein